MTQYALVTGASSGIGYEVSRKLAQKGFKVFGCSIERDIWQLRQLEPLGVVPIVCDISKIDDIKKMSEFIAQHTEGGQLDILYNNAGVSLFGGPAVEFEDEQLKSLFDVNVLGHIYVTKYLIRYVIARKGTVLFTSSVAARVPLSWVASYCATKAAIDQYAMVLHGEVKHYGVKVHSVITGGVDTAICDSISPKSLSGSLFEVPAAYESIRSSGMMSRNTNISPEKYAQEVVDKIIKKKGGFNWYHGARAYALHVFSRYFPLWIVEFGMSFHFKQLKVWRQLREKLKKNKIT